MKKKISLAGLVLSVCAFVAICVCGVYALSTLKLSIAGSITFDSSDCWVKISGNVEGSANHIANYEFFEKGLGKAKTWEIASIDFDRSQNNTIKINLSFENYSYYNVKVTISGVPESNESFDVSVDNTELCLLEYTDGGVADKESATITLTLKDGVDTAELPLALNVNCEQMGEIEFEQYFTYTLSDPNATITGLTAEGQARSALEIPDQIEGLTVTAIDASAFKDNSNLTRIKMPNTITSIGASAFENCTKLEEVNIPTSLVTLSANAFKNCQNLLSVEIPNTTTQIGTSAFYNCFNLKQAVLPEGLTTINASIFYNCVNMEDVNFPTGLETIAENAFYGCESIKTISIPEGVTSIGASAFANCGSLTEVNYSAVNCTNLTSTSKGFENAGEVSGSITLNISDDVQTIPAYLFFGGYNRLSNIVFGNNVSSIGDYAFYNCDYIKQLSFNANLKSIGNSAFGGCGALNTHLILNEGLQTIGSSAFSGCGNIPKITIPSTVTLISSQAFSYCTGVSTLNYNATSCAGFSDNANVFEDLGIGTSLQVIIGDNVQKIPAYMFYSSSANTNYIKALRIGTAVTSIGDYAFAGSDNLTNVAYNAIQCADFAKTNCVFAGLSYTSGSTFIIGESVQRVPAYLLSPVEIARVRVLTIGSNVTSIGDGAFANCPILSQINYAAKECADFVADNRVFAGAGRAGSGIYLNTSTSVTKIPAYLCCPTSSADTAPAIKKIDIRANVHGIGNYAFAYCTAITELNWNATSMGPLAANNGVFYNAFAEGSVVTIGDNVRVVPAYLFMPSTSTNNAESATKMAVLNIGTNIESIGNYAFAGCPYLTQIHYNAIGVLAYNQTGQGRYWFAGVGVGTTEGIAVRIGESVQIIPAYLFSTNNVYITSVFIPDNVRKIGRNAFAGCIRITTMTFESTTGWWYADTDTATSGTPATPTLAYLTTNSTYYSKWWNRTVS